jgi:hypothetical protein
MLRHLGGREGVQPEAHNQPRKKIKITRGAQWQGVVFACVAMSSWFLSRMAWHGGGRGTTASPHPCHTCMLWRDVHVGMCLWGLYPGGRGKCVYCAPPTPRLITHRSFGYMHHNNAWATGSTPYFMQGLCYIYLYLCVDLTCGLGNGQGTHYIWILFCANFAWGGGQYYIHVDFIMYRIYMQTM